MLKLKDVSKFYYNKGVIASGFTKVSAEFELGEFVVITGESGSGKSTLLNVLSGMDSYEEGEMYINGTETSHYTETEFEVYRKKYIGNIFQNFNLINSYTVYQNVELVLLINGYKKNEVKDKIFNILKEVDLFRFRKTKVSKLSGGQKQRVAIARALAKETPIIIADEPTGNLDTKSASSILSILHKISKEKLVVIVTHNYEQVEKYATRKIKMHDGRIVEDKRLLKTESNIKPVVSEYKNISKLNKLRLGLRNTFNIIPKFLLILFVYLFIVSALLLEYSSFKKAEYEETKAGYNGYFKNTDDKRIIIKKEDGSYFTDEDYQKITDIKNIDYVIKDDLILDNEISLMANDLYLYGPLKDKKEFSGTLDLGRMPENDNELILVGDKNDYYMSNAKSKLLDQDFALINIYNNVESKEKYKIVGIKYSDSKNYYAEMKFYGTEKILGSVRKQANERYSNFELTLSNKKYNVQFWDVNMQITPNDKVPVGKAYVSENLNFTCTNYNCRNKKLLINNKNVYYEKNQELTIGKTYNKNNFTSLTGEKYAVENDGRIYINPADYQNLFDNNFYQSSVFIKNIKEIDSTNDSLKSLGINTLAMKDALVNYDESLSQVIRIAKVVVTIVLVVVMFFISYFIIKIILKSRNVYFTTIRILGASKKVCKKLLDIELFTISNIAYFGIIIFLMLVKFNYIKFTYLKDLLTYLKLSDYIITYLILIGMTELISSKFAKSLFKKSAMKTIAEEV